MFKSKLKLFILLFLSISCSSCESKPQILLIYGKNSASKDFIWLVEKYNTEQSKNIEFKAVDNPIEADILYEQSHQLSYLYRTNQIIKLDNDVIEEKTSRVNYENISYKGDVIAYSLVNSISNVLYYNKSYISNEEASSIEKILEIAKRENKKICFPIDVVSNLFTIIGSYEGNGTSSLSYELLGEDKISYQTNWLSEESISHCEYFINLFKNAQENNLIIGRSQNVIDLMNEESIIAIISYNSIYEKDFETICQNYNNIAAKELPKYHIGENSYQMGSLAYNEAFSINASSKTKKQAMNFLKYLMKEETQNAYALEFNVTPFISEVYNELLNNGKISKVKKAEWDQNEYSTAESFIGPDTSIFNNILFDVMEAIYSNNFGDYENFKDYFYVKMSAITEPHYF